MDSGGRGEVSANISGRGCRCQCNKPFDIFGWWGVFGIHTFCIVRFLGGAGEGDFKQGTQNNESGQSVSN